jgi:hypothetical protein
MIFATNPAGRAWNCCITGDVVPRILDLFTLLGVAGLASPDKEAVEADYRRIQELQEQLITEAGED